MAEQERKYGRRDDSPQEYETDLATPRVGGALTGKIDDLLDEIDSVLEDNAEEFIKNYVQKGGE
jgi:ubiquitin-like protein Pup